MDVKKLGLNPGEFKIVELREVYQMYTEGVITNSPGNRESKGLTGLDLANFIRRCVDATKVQTDLVAKGLWSVNNIGLNDPIFAHVEGENLVIDNGWHRILTIAFILGGKKFPRISERDKHPDAVWYNAEFADKQLLTMGENRKNLVLSPICIKNIGDNRMHSEGSNRCKSYNGSEATHSLFYTSAFTENVEGIKVYKSNKDCGEVFLMQMFGMLARLSGSSTEMARKGFAAFGDSLEAAELVKEFVSWTRQFSFLKLNAGRGKSLTDLNFNKLRGIAYIAFLKAIEKDFPGLDEWKKAPYTANAFLSDITSSAMDDEVELKLDIAKMVLAELKAFTTELLAVDAKLDQAGLSHLSSTDRATSGIENWAQTSVVQDILTEGGVL